jgi:hypothetical protein
LDVTANFANSKQEKWEVERLRHIGIKDYDDLGKKYGQLCSLYELGLMDEESARESAEFISNTGIGLTGDEARAFADWVLIIMNDGQPWRMPSETGEA